MNQKIVLTFVGLGVLASLSACGFAAGQLADKAQEVQLLKPGALDASLTGVRDTYQFKFLNKLRITHDWPRNSNGCAYRARPTLDVRNGFSSEFFAVADIFELDDSTYQSVADLGRPPRNFDQSVRSKKVMAPVWETVNGVRQKVGEKEIENGWTPVCFYAWAGGQRHITLDLFKSSLADRIKVAERRAGTNRYVQIGSNKWWVRTVTIPADRANSSGGEVWVLPVGDSGYSMTFTLGTGSTSLQSTGFDAALQATFTRLIESVKVDAL